MILYYVNIIFISCLLLPLNALGTRLLIRDADGFISFSNTVNSADKYTVSTVYLDSDIDFNGKTFESIGSNYRHFRGVFDGQGHVINNLAMNSTSQYTGIFGYSTGMTIKNVVMGDNCSIVSTYSSTDYAYVGGIIGYSYSKSNEFIAENIVTMGNVTFSGSIGFSLLYLGGVIGSLGSSSIYSAIAKNCVNYGHVTQYGISKYPSIGGVIGDSTGSSDKLMYIYNCLNYGVIKQTVMGNSLLIGGIVGHSYRVIIENCVSAGPITHTEQNSHVGSIAGKTNSVSIKNCFWTNDVDYNKSSGIGIPTLDNATSEIVNYFDVLKKLNDYSSEHLWNGWILNENNDPVKFTVNNVERLTLNSQVILLPSFSNEGNAFNGWFEDSACTIPFEEKSITSDITLYAKYGVKQRGSFSSKIAPIYSTLLFL